MTKASKRPAGCRSRGTIVITQERTEDRRQWLRERAVDATIDQDPEFEMRIATEVMALLLGRLGGEPEAVTTDMRNHRSGAIQRRNGASASQSEPENSLIRMVRAVWPVLRRHKNSVIGEGPSAAHSTARLAIDGPTSLKTFQAFAEMQ